MEANGDVYEMGDNGTAASGYRNSSSGLGLGGRLRPTRYMTPETRYEVKLHGYNTENHVRRAFLTSVVVATTEWSGGGGESMEPAGGGAIEGGPMDSSNQLTAQT